MFDFKGLLASKYDIDMTWRSQVQVTKTVSLQKCKAKSAYILNPPQRPQSGKPRALGHPLPSLVSGKNGLKHCKLPLIEDLG